MFIGAASPKLFCLHIFLNFAPLRWLKYLYSNKRFEWECVCTKLIVTCFREKQHGFVQKCKRLDLALLG